MKQLKRNASLLAASAVLLGLTVSLPASAATSAGGREPLKWTKCDGPDLDPRQQCATVAVPMDYADPDGPRIQIAVSRIPSEKPSARRGALLLIPGGPGGVSLDDPSGKGQKLPQSVRDVYDLIGFAPRGMAPSSSTACGLESKDLALAKLPWPAPDGSVTEAMTTARRIADACARNGGELIRHLSTANDARDLDRVRAALGESRISAWGDSYGTYVGSVYSQLFPHRTDRIVLDSNNNPDPTRVGRAWLAAFETGVEDNFPEFAKWASRPGNPYRLARTTADVRPLFLRLAERLDRAPLPWPGADPAELNGNVLRQTMLSSLYDPDDYPALAKMILAARKGTVPPVPEAPDEAMMQNAAAVGAGILCNNVAWPKTAAQYQKGVDESRAAFPLTAGMPRGPMLCAGWPYAPREPAVRITDRGPSNILLVQNERDVASPLSGARELRRAFGDRAVMVTVNSTGHGAYLANGNACGDRTVSRFLATGERPDRDIYCA
ncbi:MULTISPECIES: alpha/beta hydrolase [Streptomyces]|uniref:Alpha/beta hydrolase n=1 Tax=Streptomyces koelreuteriae TaxID=2838015 RepID=A0ABX8FXQ0_9ACTN|nr:MULTISPECIES: alpha/beta hydrolase [Streptomyces]QWB25725.1 alpha/beta hydrolase [Streptomyces koelreuteriae]UUA08782.1 alpha/beta hydrolase [Streptomyces koelreuteriae]UUA16387.1 alpha/beta hydrolase [Streptomyces sp. CRCS-T-1]